MIDDSEETEGVHTFTGPNNPKHEGLTLPFSRLCKNCGDSLGNHSEDSCINDGWKTGDFHIKLSEIIEQKILRKKDVD